VPERGVHVILTGQETTMPDPVAEAQQAYATFIDPFRSLVLATVGAGGKPHASYAPFVVDERRHLYCLVSGMAEHTGNLQAAGRACAMFIEDESGAQQIFARRRLTYDCRADFVPAGDPLRADIARRFTERFGGIAKQLLSMPDFRPVRLVPESGRFVIGFGAAFEVEGADLSRLVHRDGGGGGHGHGAAPAGHGAAPTDDLIPGDGRLPAVAEQRIVAHMNADHAAALLGYARVHARRPDVTAARMVAIDAGGLDLVVQAGRGEERLRVAFAQPLRRASEARSVLVQMAEEARAGG
jgi:putative heme iron utilization protein